MTTKQRKYFKYRKSKHQISKAPSYLFSSGSSFIYFLCGRDVNGRMSRSVFWSMLSTLATITLLLITYFQLHDINETNAAEFSHKIKNDLYTPGKVRLITLFDSNVLLFKIDSAENVWFELDTIAYKKLNGAAGVSDKPVRNNIFEIDELLQDFEDLSFYEKRGQIKLGYIYDAYAYYIIMLWQNKELQKYILWQRSQTHTSNSYINLEKIYNVLKEKTDMEP